MMADLASDCSHLAASAVLPAGLLGHFETGVEKHFWQPGQGKSHFLSPSSLVDGFAVAATVKLSVESSC